MKRVNAKHGLLTCWSCGSSAIEVKKEDSIHTFSNYVECDDCGERTDFFAYEAQAKKAWNKAYALPVD